MQGVEESESVSCSVMCDWLRTHEPSPLSMGFPRQEYWSGWPFPTPVKLYDPGIEIGVSRIASGFLTIWVTREVAAKSPQSCLTLCDPIDGSPPGSPRPWDSPGKNTGVGCHFLLQCMKVKSESEVTHSYLTLRDPMDCSLPIFQARVLEWGAIAFSGIYCKRDINFQFLGWSTLGALTCLLYDWKKVNMLKKY